MSLGLLNVIMILSHIWYLEQMKKYIRFMHIMNILKLITPIKWYKINTQDKMKQLNSYYNKQLS
jgi:hypothetical protein